MTQRAAGTIPWCTVPGENGEQEILVLLVHRTKWKDITLPKGKMDPGETMPRTAVRETFEETGLRVHLGMMLGTIEYKLKTGEDKQVRYWAARVDDATRLASRFSPNKEIEALEWVNVKEAKSRLSYKRERDMMDIFLDLTQKDLHETFSIITLRHAQAAAEGKTDAARKLTPLGKKQAKRLASTLDAFGVKKIWTSDAERCISTVKPYARSIQTKPKLKHELSQQSWDEGNSVREVVGSALRKTRSVLLCSHLPVLSDICREIALGTASTPGPHFQIASEVAPSGFSVFHISKKYPGAGVLSVEHYSDPLAEA